MLDNENIVSGEHDANLTGTYIFARKYCPRGFWWNETLSKFNFACKYCPRKSEIEKYMNLKTTRSRLRKSANQNQLCDVYALNIDYLLLAKINAKSVSSLVQYGFRCLRVP